MPHQPDFSLRADFSKHKANAQVLNQISAAFMANDLPTVTKLLDKHPSAVHWRREPNGTILTDALWCSDPEAIALLLSRGAQVDMKDNLGLTALHTACTRDLADHAEMLIRCGADIHAEDSNGITPLYKAVDSRSLACADLLVICGVDPDKNIRFCDTNPMEKAKNNPEMVTAIRAAQQRLADAKAAALRPAPRQIIPVIAPDGPKTIKILPQPIRLRQGKFEL